MNLAAGLGLCIALLGHAAIWCALYNQLHANSWPSPSRKLLDKLIYLVVLSLAILLAVHFLRIGETTLRSELRNDILKLYSWICYVAAAIVAMRWVWQQVSHRQPSRLISSQTQKCALQEVWERQPIHGWQANVLNWIPGNQILELRVERHEIALRGLPVAADGLRIVQISDLHFTGKIGFEYFQTVAEICNRESPDLVLLTGDVIDKARCLEWFDQTLGRIRSKLGCYYVLGNHDRRIKDEKLIRDRIARAGFRSVNGKWELIEIPGGCLWLCGNELPWYRGAEVLLANPPSDLSAPRILISHTPDQFRWAQEHGINLMLAGHCHGGQIRLPLFGPIITPSRHGVRFSSGVFELGDLTLYVSRGISSDDPIRINCPPELSVIQLRCG